jgi:dihydrofolate synthase / folylpolyglutamate synthase
MRFANETEAITYVFESIAASGWQTRGLDEHTRDVTPTQHLLAAADLLQSRREYAVVTGSKGKGSATALTARLLQALGHKVGMVTSPHLTTYRQRFRINGKMISEADLVRLIDHFAPAIDSIRENLPPGKYISPQGIFLAVALQWFDENEVTAAVIEVGRGGRFDDNALVPNMLSLFTPIILEHARYLGPTPERIAWHKAGIIKPHSYAYSLPQSPGVMDVLRNEAEMLSATFEWLAPADMGQYVAPTPNGMRVDFGRYGVVDFPMLGRYEIDNASLAIWAAGNMHARLPLEEPLSHGSDEYVRRIRAGLESIVWPGRCQKLQDAPQVFIDGSINTLSARLFLESVRDRLTEPVIIILAVPRDRDYHAVYPMFASISQALILTETDRNITIKFPDPEEALRVARQHHNDVTYQPNVASALEAAKARAGQDGTVLMAVAQPAIGDTLLLYGNDYEQI